MSNFHLMIGFILTGIVFLIVDLLWLGLVAKKIYDQYLGVLLREEINWLPALLFYVLFIIAIFVFAILPAVRDDSIIRAIFLGAFFGFICYATYDLTNLATLKGWPVNIVYIDIAWGTFVTATVSAIGFMILKWLSG
ncbi:MAG: DUF2177 family protein [Saprospiraceae bacterium]|nr:DUF2177 family protein [Saprospiraceae bacterium]